MGAKGPVGPPGPKGADGKNGRLFRAPSNMALNKRVCGSEMAMFSKQYMYFSCNGL